MRVFAAAVVAAVALTIAPHPVRAGTYAFTNIADSTGPYSVFNSFSVVAGPFGQASVNGARVVTFYAQLDAGGEGVFAGSGGPIATIAQTGAGYDNVGESPSINNAGTVAFGGVATGGGPGNNVIWTRSSTGTGGTTNLADSTGPMVSGIPNNPSLSSAGKAAFRGFRDAGGEGIFRADGGGAITSIADSTGPFSGFTLSPAINAGGTVAFQARFDGEGNSGVYTGSGGALTPIAESTGSTYSNSFGSPDLNDAGTVVFRAGLDAGGSGIFVSIGGVTTTIADSSGAFSSFGSVDINNDGTVAFAATLDAGSSGIFVGPDAVADKVIATGDALFGSTLTNIGFLRGLNDNGDIAFVYKLANGTQGVALAIVPEPSTAAILALAAGAVTLGRRRRVNP